MDAPTATAVKSFAQQPFYYWENIFRTFKTI